jgi:CheY-like chemotaxis protein
MSFEAKTVLVVDDSPLVAYAVGCQAARMGFIVELAGNGEEALQRLAETSFVAVVSDVEMPVMGGFELCRNIRLRYPEIPVVMMSGLFTEERHQTALASGAKEFLEKPVTMAQLAAALSQELMAAPRPSPVERHYAFASY